MNSAPPKPGCIGLKRDHHPFPSGKFLLSEDQRKAFPLDSGASDFTISFKPETEI